MRVLLLLMLFASPLWACCPTDPDRLGDEATPELLDFIAGKVERPTQAHWQAVLDNESTGIEHARALAGVGRVSDALDSTTDLETAETIDLRLKLALTLWWQGGSDTYPASACLDLASGLAARHPQKALYSLMIEWARLKLTTDPEAYLPEFFKLRYFPNKTESHDTGLLEKRGLGEAEALLIDLIRFDPVWENFDTIYALSMVYVVTGRQNLAGYTRMRAAEMHEAGKTSRVPGAAEIEDIRPMLVLRQTLADVLQPVMVIDEESQREIETQYAARRAYAIDWLAARQSYATSQLIAGVAANAADFWAGFTAPYVSIPAPSVKTEASTPVSEPTTPQTSTETSKVAEEKPESPSRSGMWITLGALICVLVIGGFTKSRIDAAAKKTPPPQEPSA